MAFAPHGLGSQGETISFKGMDSNVQPVKGSPINPAVHVHTDAQTRFKGHSEFTTHSGRQFGGAPTKLSKQEQEGEFPTTRHSELGPHGLGKQGWDLSVSLIGSLGIGWQLTNGFPVKLSEHAHIGEWLTTLQREFNPQRFVFNSLNGRFKPYNLKAYVCEQFDSLRTGHLCSLQGNCNLVYDYEQCIMRYKRRIQDKGRRNAYSNKPCLTDIRSLLNILADSLVALPNIEVSKRKKDHQCNLAHSNTSEYGLQRDTENFHRIEYGPHGEGKQGSLIISTDFMGGEAKYKRIMAIFLHSPFDVHSGRHVGGMPMYPDKQEHTAWELISRHTELGPQGDGRHGFDYPYKGNESAYVLLAYCTSDKDLPCNQEDSYRSLCYEDIPKTSYIPGGIMEGFLHIQASKNKLVVHLFGDSSNLDRKETADKG
ncbi:hypothetical protein GQX74_002302 [Glossina fuscipes]|nr:hypothetical protein GQX74_002302 [Glossina fuscipes]